MVCFGEKIWIKLKEVLVEKKGSFKKRGSKRGKKVVGVSKATEAGQSNGNYVRCFRLNGSGIRISPWWEKKNWAMVADQENPYGDLTREEHIKIAELLKGIRKPLREPLENGTSAKSERGLKQKSGHMGLKG